MHKLYVGILLLAFFCSVDAMEADVPKQSASLSKGLYFEEQLRDMRKVFDGAIEQEGDVQQAGENILAHLKGWFLLALCKEEECNRNTVSTIDQDLSDAQKRLDQSDYTKFYSCTFNAENLILSLMRQREREIRRQNKAQEPESAELRYRMPEGSDGSYNCSFY